MSGHAYSARSQRRLRREPHRAGSGRALAVAAACALALALIWVIANLVPPVHLRDAVALRDFTLLSRPRLDAVANFLLTLLDPLLFVIWGAALLATALARRLPRVAVAVLAVLALAPLTSETLKPLLAHPHAQVSGVHIGAASWPSGHATAALSLAFAALLVSPPRVRPLVAVVGAAYALAVGCALLILAWHMPSDVAGGYLIAALWTALAVAALRASERRWPSSRSPAA